MTQGKWGKRGGRQDGERGERRSFVRGSPPICCRKHHRTARARHGRSRRRRTGRGTTPGGGAGRRLLHRAPAGRSSAPPRPARGPRPARSRRRTRTVTVDAARGSAIAESRHDAAGERRHGARPRRAANQAARTNGSGSRRTPKGSYADGTWSKIASMPSRLRPAVLRLGDPARRPHDRRGRRVPRRRTPCGRTRAPSTTRVTNTWRSVAPPAGWTNIGDAQSDVLANGTFMLAQACQNCLSSSPILSTDDALFNATGLTWTAIPGAGQERPQRRGGLDARAQRPAADDRHLADADDRAVHADQPQLELRREHRDLAGQQPGGRDRPAGRDAGRQHVRGRRRDEQPEAPERLHDAQRPPRRRSTTTRPRKWLKGPPIPTIEGLQYDSADGPGSVLPDGNVLFDVSPCVYNAPLAFYLYERQHAQDSSPVPDIPNAANDSTYYTRLLALPNGQVLFDDGSNQMEVYTAGGTPNPAWAPSITVDQHDGPDAGQDRQPVRHAARGARPGRRLRRRRPGRHQLPARAHHKYRNGRGHLRADE